MIATKRNRTAITSASHNFAAGDRTSRKKRKHSLPGVGRTEAKAEQILIFRVALLPPRQAPYLCRRSMIDLANTGVEAAHTPETGRNRDLSHGQASLINELLGKIQTTGVGHRYWCRAQVFQEQSPKM